MKKLLTALFIAVLLFITANPLIALEKKAEVQEVNSFELFWPVSAGKTLGDSLYSLKLFKEKVRSLLIFGKLQKLDYSLFLSIKRAVETEKLISEGKFDLATKTLDKMELSLTTAEKNTDIPVELKNKAEIDEINKKLSNLETFMTWLASKENQVKEQLLRIRTKVEQIDDKI